MRTVVMTHQIKVTERERRLVELFRLMGESDREVLLEIAEKIIMLGAQRDRET